MVKIIVLSLLINLTVLNLFAQTCVCPVVTMIEPDSVIKSGEQAVFTVDVKGWKNPITYQWSVSAGRIVEGQGTAVIKVDTSGMEGQSVEATVKVVGDWCPACTDTTVSGVAVMEIPVNPRLVDEFERGTCEEVLARMDSFFNELQNDPSASGYILIYGTARSSRAAEREARNWITIRRFDATRITLLPGGSKSQSQTRAFIEMWLVPAGAKPPEVTVAPDPVVPSQVASPSTEAEKPYLFTSQTVDGIDGCKPLFDIEGYIKALRENPKSRGNIVILESSQTAFKQTERDILTELIKGGIERKRLRTFFKKVRPNNLAEGIELWLIP